MLSIIIKFWVQPPTRLFGEAVGAITWMFVLEHNESNKNYKDTIFLKCINPEIFRWEYMNPGIDLLPGNSDLRDARNLSNTSINLTLERVRISISLKKPEI
jgi:hypothetical protein